MVAREGDTRRVRRSKSPEMKYISRSIDSANKKYHRKIYRRCLWPKFRVAGFEEREVLMNVCEL